MRKRSNRRKRTIKSRRKNRRVSNKKRRKRRRFRNNRRRLQSGGGAIVGAAPKGPFLAPYTWADPFPSGNAYKAGDVNGLKGGYYYPTVMNPYLPDPNSTVGKMGIPKYYKGGYRVRKHRHSRKHRHKKNCNCLRKRRRSKRSGVRNSKRRFKNQRGGGLRGPIENLINTLLPSDVLDVGRNYLHDIGGWYNGYFGQNQSPSPNPIQQPLDMSSLVT